MVTKIKRKRKNKNLSTIVKSFATGFLTGILSLNLINTYIHKNHYFYKPREDLKLKTILETNKCKVLDYTTKCYIVEKYNSSNKSSLNKIENFVKSQQLNKTSKIDEFFKRYQNIFKSYSDKEIYFVYDKVNYYKKYLKDYLTKINTLDKMILQTIGNFNVIKKYSEKYGVPLNVSLGIFLIENSGNRKAVSITGNAGLWQLSEYLAKHYGLKINQYVDERFISEKSADAATHYLKDLYERFGRWDLAILSYHQGESRVANMIVDYIKYNFGHNYSTSDVWAELIKDYNINLKKLLDDKRIVDKYFEEDFKLNGKNYVWKVLAMEEIFREYIKEHNIFPVTRYVTYRIKPGDTLYKIKYKIKDHYSIEPKISEILDHNPWIRDPNILIKDYVLYIPIGKRSLKINPMDYKF